LIWAVELVDATGQYSAMSSVAQADFTPQFRIDHHARLSVHQRKRIPDPLRRHDHYMA
jgi:hypothetical protein